MLGRGKLVLWEAAKGNRENRTRNPRCQYAQKDLGAEQVAPLPAQLFEKQTYGYLGRAVPSQE
ncbi:hypothetical protein N7501_009783 [Penicillium viridicatum]|nr:hypothetical protein N7501_009783 [Penicillium viridicatum]